MLTLHFYIGNPIEGSATKQNQQQDFGFQDFSTNFIILIMILGFQLRFQSDL